VAFQGKQPSDTKLHNCRLFAACRFVRMVSIVPGCPGHIIEEHPMFGKKDPAAIKTLIAQGTRIDGDMKFDDGLRVDGEVYGAIHANSEGGSMLVISEGAVAEGGLKADHIIINGTVKGPVEARELLELQPKAKIEGDVQYVSLEMHQGATIFGQLRPMGSATASSGDEKPLFRLATKSA
jgi:cytoskeletal protein CcmA (bactofilin family)